jgi:hypothetical protein
VILGPALVLAGIVGGIACVVILTSQGLDRSSKWISIVVGLISVAVSTSGLRLGWLNWRRQRDQGPRPVNASSVGAVAVGGDPSAKITTDVSDVEHVAKLRSPPTAGVNADGIGSVAVGGNSNAPIRTKVTGVRGEQHRRGSTSP